ncbi:MAG TPA: hypothetical protein GXX50_09345, partial [Firmicutes bacterium]|nr:hypothetical protein [Bacillota bacterium]
SCCQHPLGYPAGSDGFRVFLATPFGYEKDVLDPAIYDQAKDELEKAIQMMLATDEESFRLSKFERQVKSWLQRALADTQRPLNDITVWDVGHSGMAFLKAGIWSLHQKGSTSHQELEKQKAYWRILRYGLKGLEFLDQAVSVPDLAARQCLLKNELDAMKRFLEEEYPVATEVYRDENGSLYVFPDLDWQSEWWTAKTHLDDKPRQDPVSGGLKLADVYGLKPHLEVTPGPYYHRPNRGPQGDLPYIGTQIREWITDPPTAEVHLAAFATTGQKQGELCPYCGVRIIGGGAELVSDGAVELQRYSEQSRQLKMCCPCLKLREGRAADWVKRIAGGDKAYTIWLNEVADVNGRLALVVGRWDVEQFMERMHYPQKGTKRFVILARATFLGDAVPSHGQKLRVGVRRKSVDLDWNAAKQELIGIHEGDRPDIGRFQRDQLSIQLLDKEASTLTATLVELAQEGEELYLYLQKEAAITSRLIPERKVKIFGCDFIVVDKHILRPAGIEAKKKILEVCCWQSDGCTFFLSTIQTIPLTPVVHSESFARLRRVWETTRQFWKEAMYDFQQRSEPSKFRRLELHSREPGDWAANQAYELLLDGAKLSVVWDGERKCFITADNLAYLSQPQQLGEDVQHWLQTHLGQPLSVIQSTGYGSSDKRVGDFTIERAEDVQVKSESNHTPSISILTEPQTFMVLVPAQAALELVRSIKQKYEREMGKVRPRLALHLGVVFAFRRTPLRVILDAGRRMLRVSSPPAVWDVESTATKGGRVAPSYLRGDPHFATWQELVLRRRTDGRRAIWRVPLKMGDGTSDDKWYPLVALEGIAPQRGLAHVKVIQPRDDILHHGIEFIPTTFDFEFLDTGGRRFEIAYDDQGWRRGRLRGRRPYLLDECDVLEDIWRELRCGLTLNQIHILRDTIEAKRVEWGLQGESCPQGQTVFLQFCRDMVAAAAWKPGTRPDTEKLALYAARGWLADAVELFLEILKRNDSQVERGDGDYGLTV